MYASPWFLCVFVAMLPGLYYGCEMVGVLDDCPSEFGFLNH